MSFNIYKTKIGDLEKASTVRPRPRPQYVYTYVALTPIPEDLESGLALAAHLHTQYIRLFSSVFKLALRSICFALLVFGHRLVYNLLTKDREQPQLQSQTRHQSHTLSPRTMNTDYFNQSNTTGDSYPPDPATWSIFDKKKIWIGFLIGCAARVVYFLVNECGHYYESRLSRVGRREEARSRAIGGGRGRGRAGGLEEVE